jgi:hypothetical protein
MSKTRIGDLEQQIESLVRDHVAALRGCFQREVFVAGVKGQNFT